MNGPSTSDCRVGMDGSDLRLPECSPMVYLFEILPQNSLCIGRGGVDNTDGTHVELSLKVVLLSSRKEDREIEDPSLLKGCLLGEVLLLTKLDLLSHKEYLKVLWLLFLLLLRERIKLLPFRRAMRTGPPATPKPMFDPLELEVDLLLLLSLGDDANRNGMEEEEEESKVAKMLNDMGIYFEVPKKPGIWPRSLRQRLQLVTLGHIRPR
ncbi:hypothetical protein AMTR_s00037p00147430 [Amborella trichopoda]|uniref:Uncharacterized protein n=1 Tax=Amborella trichopoda TaxID=13333 RepID=U5DAD2_AMBTC|nr:hypothetical protein AMTR_s00037p00147430 [Amborella trichopoda]